MTTGDQFMRATLRLALVAALSAACLGTAGAQNAKSTATPYMTDQEYMKQVGTPPASQFAPRKNTFEKLTGDLYRAGDGTWFVGILVTPDGILLVDTLNPGFAKWLKAQLAERFPGKPVKYVIYSHTHWDHIDGSTQFADTAKFIAQENALHESRRPLSAHARRHARPQRQRQDGSAARSASR